MKRSTSRRADWVVAALWLALAALPVGCVSPDGVAKDVLRSRKAAYRAWKRSKEGRGGDQMTLDRPLDAKSYEAWRRKRALHPRGQIVLQGKLDTASAVLLAIGNNKRLRAVLEEKEKALGTITEAYSAALPKLDLEGSYTGLDHRAVAVGQRSNYAVGLVATQPIFRGGAIGAGIRGARILTHLADEQVAEVLQDVVHKTRLGYYDVLLAKRLVKVSEGDLELAKAHFKDVKIKRIAGVRAEYDVLRAGVEVSNVEAELIGRQNTLHLAVTSLLKTLGVSQESRVELTDRLTYEPFVPDLDKAAEKAFQNRPEILQAELTVRLKREEVVGARSGLRPRLDATLTHARARPDPYAPARDHWDREWSAALVLTVPLFDGFATRGRVRQAQAELRRSGIQLSQAEEQALFDVKQAVLSIRDTEKFYRSQQKNLGRAKEALRLAAAGYKAGVKTEIQMLDVRQALSATRALYYQAVHGHKVARLALQRATGELRRGKLGGLLK